MLARVQRGRAAIVALPVEEDYATATVTLTRADGTTLVEDEPVSISPSDDGLGFDATVQLDPVAELDLLTATWTLDGETAVSFVEVVGGFGATLRELRRVDPLDDATKYADADLERGRLVAETALEDACGCAFVPRFRRVRIDGSGTCDLFLPVPLVTAVRAGSVDGTALSTDELAELVIYEDEGLIYSPSGWASGRRNVVLDVEHGYTSPPGRVGVAVQQLVRHVLVDSPVDDRAISTTNEDGNVSVFVQAGVRGAIFALPEANAAVGQYGFREVA